MSWKVSVAGDDFKILVALGGWSIGRSAWIVLRRSD